MFREREETIIWFANRWSVSVLLRGEDATFVQTREERSFVSVNSRSFLIVNTSNLCRKWRLLFYEWSSKRKFHLYSNLFLFVKVSFEWQRSDLIFVKVEKHRHLKDSRLVWRRAEWQMRTKGKWSLSKCFSLNFDVGEKRKRETSDFRWKLISAANCLTCNAFSPLCVDFRTSHIWFHRLLVETLWLCVERDSFFLLNPIRILLLFREVLQARRRNFCFTSFLFRIEEETKLDRRSERSSIDNLSKIHNLSFESFEKLEIWRLRRRSNLMKLK